jgi:hypothetical protein
MASFVSVETTPEKASLPEKKKNLVRVGGSLEISGSIDDGNLGRKKKKKKKKPCPSVGGSLEISGNIDDGSLGRKKKRKKKPMITRLYTPVSGPWFRTSISGPDPVRPSRSCPFVEVLKPRSAPGRTDRHTAKLIK